MDSVTIKVVGNKTMGCSGCEGNVESTLGDVDGVNEVRADRQSQSVEIYFDKAVGMEVIAAEMNQMGYQIEAA